MCVCVCVRACVCVCVCVCLPAQGKESHIRNNDEITQYMYMNEKEMSQCAHSCSHLKTNELNKIAFLIIIVSECIVYNLVY